MRARDGPLAAGGGRGTSALLRFDAGGWRAQPVDANGLRAVLPLSGEAVVVAGEHGYLAIIDGEGVSPVELPGYDGCLYALVRVGELVWVTGDAGFVATLDPRSVELRVQSQFTSDPVTRAVTAPGGELVFVAGRQLMRRLADGTVEPGFSGRAPLTDIAYAPDGRWHYASSARRGDLRRHDRGSPRPGLPRPNRRRERALPRSQ